MMWKQVLFLVLIIASCAFGFRGSMGSRKPNDRLLFSISRSSMPSGAPGKHELEIIERKVNATYIEYSLNPQPSEIRIREFSGININLIFTSEQATQLSGEIKVFGYPD